MTRLSTGREQFAWKFLRGVILLNLAILVFSITAGTCAGVYLGLTDNPVRDQVQEWIR